MVNLINMSRGSSDKWVNCRYYNNVFDQELASLITRPRGPEDIVNEVLGLDKEILRDIRWVI